MYVSDVDSTIFRPEKELKAFQKVFLEPAEEKQVSLKLDRRAFAFYNVKTHDWCVESGEFKILIGASSRDIRLQERLIVNAPAVEIPDYSQSIPHYYDDITAITHDDFKILYGKKLPSPQIDTRKRIDKYCCFDDAKDTKWGGRICKCIYHTVKVFAAKDENNHGDAALIAKMSTQMPLRNYVSSTMGAFTPEMLEGLLNVLNDDESTAKGVSKILAGLPNLIKNLPAIIKST